MMKPALICIVGPTASGKSALAVSLAQALDAEVVSADSMQIYRGMDIGTAKMTTGEMDGIVHHGLDLLEPEEHYNVEAFQRYARQTIGEISGRGRIPVLCGGTGLFVHSVLFPMGFTEAGEDPEIRKRLTQQAQDKGKEALHQQLMAVDDVSAGRIHPHNLKRVIRALEVYELTGKPMSSFDEGSFNRPQSIYQPLIWIGLYLDRPLLWERIDRRVDTMVAAGLVNEVGSLWKRGLRPETHSAMQGIGYRQFAPYFRDEAPLKDCIERVKIETRQFAKRQMSWFKREESILWLDGALGTKALTRIALEKIGKEDK